MAIAPTPMPRSARPGGYPDQNPFWNNPAFKSYASNALMDLGYGLSHGTNIPQALGYATKLSHKLTPQREEERLRQQEIAETAEQKNKTIQTMLEAGREDLANMAEAGQMAQAWKLFAEAQQPTNGPDAPSSVREWEYFNGLDDAQKAQYLTMKRATPWLNTKTDLVRPDPLSGDMSGAPSIPINNEAAARDTAIGSGMGKVDAENIAAAESLASKMPGLQQVVSELGDLAEKATYTQAGKLWDDIMRETGQMPSEGALARTKYIAMVDNQVLPLLRDIFGAAFTVQEGESLRATLGAPDKSPAEKKAVLEAFINQKVRDLQAMQSRVGGGATPGGGVDDILSEYGL